MRQKKKVLTKPSQTPKYLTSLNYGDKERLRLVIAYDP